MARFIRYITPIKKSITDYTLLVFFVSYRIILIWILRKLKPNFISECLLNLWNTDLDILYVPIDVWDDNNCLMAKRYVIIREASLSSFDYVKV